MAERIFSKCRLFLSLSRSYCISSVHRKQITRNLATTDSVLTEGESRILFVTEDCVLEELETVQDLVSRNLEVHENFISGDEETLLLKEVEPYLKGFRYQYDHWDDAIHGYRETEKSRWSDENLKLFKKMKDLAIPHGIKILPHIHVLDLDRNGYIKPHIDSVKFCGSTIAGLSLLSPSVMRFIHKKHTAVKVDVLLNPRSLYIIRNTVRYEFTHEILREQESHWNGREVFRGRRIALLMRCEPE